MKILHDDEDTTILYLRDDGPQRPSSRRVVPFNPEWVDENGLLTNLASWVAQELNPGETVHGVRWVHFRPFPFHVRRDPVKGGGSMGRYFRGEFEMENGDILIVDPGKISFWDSRTRRMVRCYYEYVVDNGTTWKLDVEVRRVYERNYHDCPAILAYAYTHIDSMLYAMTRVPHKHMEMMVPLYGRDGPNHRDKEQCKETPPVIQKIYHYVRDHYFARPSLPRDATPDVALFEQFREAVRTILLADRIPDPLFPLSETLHE